MIVLDKSMLDVIHVLITFQALTKSWAICFSIFPGIEDKLIGLQLSGLPFSLKHFLKVDITLALF